MGLRWDICDGFMLPICLDRKKEEVMLPTHDNMVKVRTIQSRWVAIKGYLLEATDIFEKWLLDQKPPGGHRTLERSGYAKEYAELDLMLAWRHLHGLARDYSAVHIPGMFWYYMAKAGEGFIDIIEMD